MLRYPIQKEEGGKRQSIHIRSFFVPFIHSCLYFSRVLILFMIKVLGILSQFISWVLCCLIVNKVIFSSIFDTGKKVNVMDRFLAWTKEESMLHGGVQDALIFILLIILSLRCLQGIHYRCSVSKEHSRNPSKT